MSVANLVILLVNVVRGLVLEGLAVDVVAAAAELLPDTVGVQAMVEGAIVLVTVLLQDVAVFHLVVVVTASHLLLNTGVRNHLLINVVVRSHLLINVAVKSHHLIPMGLLLSKIRSKARVKFDTRWLCCKLCASIPLLGLHLPLAHLWNYCLK
ncbi:serine/arginine-rich splicing factor RSZ21A-like [Iris pallida]|uniref:Serine/arginine-rich splicing factor RSZ21A-like n=1 Tax=Iris pallida TaxID=29817 RepID=A0AAX6DW65_IRIPA|nr:serine/arginine-rich splicing factor RSZ21A-like [Iris pallida]